MPGVYQDGEVVGAGVDYIAASASSGRRERRLHQLGEAEVANAIARGERETPWTAYGYSGIRAGASSVGGGNGGTIVRVSGPRAASICREIVRYADKVSRIDIQATVRFNRDIAALARRSAQELQANQRQRKRRIGARLERTFGRGDTLYVGSRNSQWFGRIYDKHRESKAEEYIRCWRYEVECKDDAAQKASRFAESVGYDSSAIAGAIRDWYCSRGITPRYRSTVARCIGVVGASDTDAAGQLRWLAYGVAPVVKRLARVYGIDAVLAVLVSGRDPGAVLPLRVEVDEAMADYDEWTIATADQLI